MGTKQETKPKAAQKLVATKAKDLPAKKDAKGGLRAGWYNHNETLVRA